MKFKHNQRVTCEIKGEKITDAKISIDKNGRYFICQNKIEGSDAEDKLGYKHSWWLDRDFTSSFVTNLKPALKDWDSLQEGDEIKDDSGDVRTILGICGKVIFLSACCDKNQFGYGYTKEELKQLIDNIREKLK